jgi:tetratricopeptide (TPR) repeat protein
MTISRHATKDRTMKKVVRDCLKHSGFALLISFCCLSHPAWAGSYELGLQQYEQGNYVMALQYLRSAISESNSQSQNPNIRYYLADTYLKLNRLAEAQAEYQTVMSLAPDSQAAKLSKVALTHLRAYINEAPSDRSKGTVPNLSGAGSNGPDQYMGPIDNGEDYLDEVLANGRVVRWSLAKMPLKIYVERSPMGIRNFQPAFINQVNRGIMPWANALNHQLSYVWVNSSEQADIRISWINTIDTKGHSSDGGTAYTAGLTQPNTRGNQLHYMDVKIATFDIEGKPQTENIIASVAIHELGHALGLLGHSSHEDDIMCASNDSVTAPSKRDINTIRKLYRLPPDINNLPASSRPKNEKREQELASKLDEGITKMEAFIKTDDTALNWLNLGVLYFQKAKQLDQANKPKAEVDAWYQKALAANTQAIQREPKDPRAYHKQSLVYQALEDYPKALQNIEISISLDHKEPIYYMLDAWYLAKLGQAGRARAALDTYLLYKPGEANSDDVKLILEALKQKP